MTAISGTKHTHTHTLNQIKPTDFISTYFRITNSLSTLDIYVEIEADSQWDCKSPALTFQLCLSLTHECLSSFVSSLVQYGSNQRSVTLREKHLLVFMCSSADSPGRTWCEICRLYTLLESISWTDDRLMITIKIKENREKTTHCFVCSHETLINEAFRSNKVFVRQGLSCSLLKFYGSR